MAVWRAHKTLELIDQAICKDGGNAFRRLQGQVLPHMLDAYREDDDSFRSHLGASVIGGKCERAIKFAWLWAHKKKPTGKKGENPIKAESRMRRLWNRGHLEEGRFIALLLMIGVQVYQQDEEGKQYRISAFGGHFAGSGDGILINVPDLPLGVPALGEFKTHSGKSFDDLIDAGVQLAKPEHYAQMQEYMHHFGLLYTLYVAINKDTEELWMEIVVYDRVVAEHFLERARKIIFEPGLPRRLPGASPAYHHCRYLCDQKDVCFHTVEPERNCRTCMNVEFHINGEIACGIREADVLTKEAQLAGCDQYSLSRELK